MPHLRPLLPLLCLGTLVPGNVEGQEDTSAQEVSAFEHLTASAGVGTSRLGNPFDRFWLPGTPLHLSLATPMLGGYMRAGVYSERMRSEAEDVPGYHAILPYVEWGPAGRVGPVEWTLGAGVGTYRMIIDREINSGEMEMALVGGAQLSVDLGWSWHAGMRGHLRRVLLSETLDQPVLTLELGRRWHPGERVRALLDGTSATAGGSEEEGDGSDVRPGPEADASRLLPDPFTGRRVFAGEELRAAGLTGLTGLLARLPDWSVSTVNLRTWWGSPKGLSSWDDPDWDVWVDGVPQHLQTLGLTTLDRVGVSMAEVDSVVVVSVPGLHDGDFSDGGRIHVHTGRPVDGVTVRAEGSASQPTRDPGPLADTPLRTRNIDRLGSGTGAAVDVGAGPFRASVGIRSLDAFYTDADGSSRVIAVRDPADRFPIVETLALRASLGLYTGNGRHRLVFGRSDRDDLVHHPDVALEFPARNRHRSAGLAGTVLAGPGSEVSYRAAWTENRILARPGNFDFGRDLLVRDGDAAAWVGRTRGRWSWRAGAGAARAVERFGVDGEDVEDASTSLRGFGSVTFAGAPSADGASPVVGGVRASLEVEGARVEGGFAPRATVRAGTSLGAAEVAGAVTWSRRQPRERQGLWSLWHRGFELPVARGLEPFSPAADAESPPARELAAVDLELRVPRGPVAVRVFADGRDFRGVLLAGPRFDLDHPEAVPRPRPPTAVSAAGGGVVGAGAEVVGVSLEGRLEARGHYRWRGAVRGDPAFREAWDAIPRHRAQGSVRVRGPSAMTFHGRVEAWSSTRWARFETAGTPLPLSGGAEVELGANKAFWNGRARVGLVVADVLDRDVRRSPLAASPGLTFRVYGTIRAGG